MATMSTLYRQAIWDGNLRMGTSVIILNYIDKDLSGFLTSTFE